MAKATRVLSTPRRTAPKIKAKTAVSPEEHSCDRAYRRLEEGVCDLDRLCEITLNLIRASNESPGDLQLGAHAALMAEITSGWMKVFRRTYFDWYKSPPTDGESFIVSPSLQRR
jgi:hypothetical protein